MAYDGVVWDEAIPDNNSVANTIDDHMVDMKKGVRLRMANEHQWPSAQTGTTQAGKHLYVTMTRVAAAPTIAVASGTAQQGAIYVKTVGTTGDALFFAVDTAEIQLTDGILPIISTGAVLQVVNSLYTTTVTGTTLLPYDDTIPQITEGDEYMSRAITPTSTSNKLKIDVLWFGDNSVANQLAVALFQGTTANAIAVSGPVYCAGGIGIVIPHSFYVTAVTTAAMTFTARVGGPNAGTTRMNMVGASRYYGGKLTSSITITEIKA